MRTNDSGIICCSRLGICLTLVVALLFFVLIALDLSVNAPCFGDAINGEALPIVSLHHSLLIVDLMDIEHVVLPTPKLRKIADLGAINGFVSPHERRAWVWLSLLLCKAMETILTRLVPLGWTAPPAFRAHAIH